MHLVREGARAPADAGAPALRARRAATRQRSLQQHRCASVTLPSCCCHALHCSCRLGMRAPSLSTRPGAAEGWQQMQYSCGTRCLLCRDSPQQAHPSCLQRMHPFPSAAPPHCRRFHPISKAAGDLSEFDAQDLLPPPLVVRRRWRRGVLELSTAGRQLHGCGLRGGSAGCHGAQPARTRPIPLPAHRHAGGPQRGRQPRGGDGHP